MKNSINRHLFKAFLVIAFISLAFMQWKKEKTNTKPTNIAIKHISEKLTE